MHNVQGINPRKNSKNKAKEIEKKENMNIRLNIIFELSMIYY